MRLETPEELKTLPDGTVFVSEPECLWSGRYAGVRWRKIDNLTIECLDKKDGFGFDRTKSVSYLPSFRDPMPVRVEEEE